MKLHELKIKYEYLKEVQTEGALYKITYILKDAEEYGLDSNYCILGIKKVILKEVE